MINIRYVLFTVAFALLVTFLIVSGCTQPRYVLVPVELPLPQRPLLPTVTAGELDCLSDDVVDRIEARDDLRRQSQEELEAIIKATHN